MNPHLRLLSLASLLLLGLSAPCAAAELRLPAILSDHAVLQRGVPIHIWGWSAPGERVTAALHGQTRTAVADLYGEWQLWLMPEQAGGPYTLTISSGGAGKQRLAVEDLLIGDVWIASGQSNMEMPLAGFPNAAVIKNSEQEIASANLSQLRLLQVARVASSNPLVDMTSTWKLCTPQTAAAFSAIGYLFARDISRQEHVPVGIIDSTWGGTPIESWMSLNALGEDASLMPLYATRARLEEEQSRVAQVKAMEQREDAVAAQAHQPAPKHPWHAFAASIEPGAIYNGMIAPLTPYSIKGFLWYQGESNTDSTRAPLYHKLLPAMIADWRAHWQQGSLPFLYVQISSFHAEGDGWGMVRDAQRRTLSVTDTAMAVSQDVGEPLNVHPPDKQTVANRLALAARGLVYREPVHYAGPLFRQATLEDGGMRVWFDQAANGLHVVATASDVLDKTFELAGADHKFTPARAVIEGETIRVTSPETKTPLYVRYAWSSDSKGGLEDEMGLPVSTFTSE